jgi:hypothetical protein
VPTNDLILSELESLAAHFGAWSQSLVLGGGVALVVYDRCMAPASARPVATTDMDFLIPRKPAVPSDAQSLYQILLRQKFRHRQKDLGNPPIESYVKEIRDIEIEVEFLTDDRARKKAESAPIARAQVVAQPLSYLEMSLESVTSATLPGGTEVRVVRPEAWVFHKGLTFTRRKPGSGKAAKDLYGIWFVLTMLGPLSDATWVALKRLYASHPAAWEKAFVSNLEAWAEEASPRGWGELLAQDPERRLTEIAFRSLVKRCRS